MTWSGATPTGEHPDDERLAMYHDGDGSEAERSAITAHVETCDRCRGELQQYGAMLQLLDALPEHPAPRSFALDELTVRRRTRALWSAYASLAASVLFVFAMVGTLLGGGQGGTLSTDQAMRTESAPDMAADFAPPETQATQAALEVALDAQVAPTQGASGQSEADAGTEATAAGDVSISVDALVTAVEPTPATPGARGEGQSSALAPRTAVTRTRRSTVPATVVIADPSQEQAEMPAADQAPAKALRTPKAPGTATPQVIQALILTPSATVVGNELDSGTSQPAPEQGASRNAQPSATATGRDSTVAWSFGGLAVLSLILSLYFVRRARQV